MRDIAYLTFNADGVTGMKKRHPSLRQGEYAVAVEVRVPDEFFARGIPLAVVEIPEDAIIEPEVEVTVDG